MEKTSDKSVFLSSTPDILPMMLKITTIIIATFAFFYQDLAIIFNDALTSEINNYIIIVPLIFVFLIYRKRKMLRAAIPLKQQFLTKETKYLPTITGILLFTASIVFYWRGSYTATPLEFHMLVLPIFVAGIILILFNPQTLRQMMFPLMFLIFLIPPPAEILYGLGTTLSIISSQVSFGIVTALGIPSILSSEYGNPTITITRPNNTIIPFSVDVACSGVYSLIGFLIFAVFIAYLIRDKIQKKLIVFMIGFPLIYMLNIARITSIILIGYHFGEELALDIFHLLGGWILIFLGTLLLLIISEKIFHIQLFTTPLEQCTTCKPPTKTEQIFCFDCGKILKLDSLKISKNDLIKIVAIALSIIFILSLQVPVFALTKGGAIEYNTSSGQIDKKILPEIENYTLISRGRDFEYETLVNQDLAAWYIYSPINGTDQQLEIHVGVEIAQTWSSMHSLYYCLNVQPIIDYGQPKVKTIVYKDVQLMENPPILATYFFFQWEDTNGEEPNGEDTNLLEAAIWWYENPTFSINSTMQQKIARITLITYPNNITDLSSIERQLTDHAKSIAEYWEPIKFWSPLTILLSQNGDPLLILIMAFLIGVVIFYLFFRRKERKRLLRTYNKISNINKQIFNITLQTEKTTLPTLNNISLNYQKMTETPIDKVQLIKDLSTLQKIGLLKKVIISKNDQPIIGWKTQISLK